MFASSIKPFFLSTSSKDGAGRHVGKKYAKRAFIISTSTGDAGRGKARSLTCPCACVRSSLNLNWTFWPFLALTKIPRRSRSQVGRTQVRRISSTYKNEREHAFRARNGKDCAYVLQPVHAGLFSQK